MRAIAAPVAVGLILFAVNSLLLGILFSYSPAFSQLTYGRGSWWLNEAWPVKAAYVGVIAPFIEELLFRRLLYGYFLKKGQAKAGLAISSILFGLWHIPFGWGALKAADMALVGIVFGLAYKRWGFKGSLLAHYANNMMAVLAMSF